MQQLVLRKSLILELPHVEKIQSSQNPDNGPAHFHVVITVASGGTAAELSTIPRARPCY